MALQTVIRALYPPQCLMCEERLDTDHSLCPDCRREATFLTGAACDCCALPLPGQADPGALCDFCRHEARPWEKGRAAMVYGGTARRLVMALKHGDRLDIVPGAAAWMARAGADLITPDSRLIPVPLHWSRRLIRRYNQAALLAQAMARDTGATYLPQALLRPKRTPKLDGLGRAARHTMLKDAIAPFDTRQVEGAHCILVDDVLTTGATLAAAAHVLWQSGADRVDVIALARVAFGE